MYAIERGIHGTLLMLSYGIIMFLLSSYTVLVTKPAVQTLAHHNELIAAAKKHGVVCMVEHHKRFDT